MKKQKLRSEIDNKYKWDLTTLFKTDEDFLNELKSVKNDMVEISKYEDQIKDETLAKEVRYNMTRDSYTEVSINGKNVNIDAEVVKELI